MTEKNPEELVRSVSRALRLLRSFNQERQSLTLQEMAAHADVPKSTAVRLLDTLIAEGMVVKNDTARTYSPGFGFVHWMQIAHARWGIPASATEEMKKVAQLSGESVSLYVRSGGSRIALEHIPGSQTLRHMINLGEPMPLYAGATSWVLLKDAGPDLLEVIDRRLRERRSQLKVRERIAKADRYGYAFSTGEREVGVAGLSVPLNDSDGSRFGALTIGGPTARLTGDRVPELVEVLHRSANVISPMINGVGSSRP
jgi:DNA-binding IclR family transcriptional regulator